MRNNAIRYSGEDPGLFKWEADSLGLQNHWGYATKLLQFENWNLIECRARDTRTTTKRLQCGTFPEQLSIFMIPLFFFFMIYLSKKGGAATDSTHPPTPYSVPGILAMDA